ncbi:hypothetical protein LOC67_02255 [Stieleria sp. JC731]|uniref:hypothetical protein n=1 Tax=Pirellulaceae TaxID=2691357 RepID=UPI001E65BADD|nr:hypothetical protein [Stieleria sp. JC731]MCC9599366.1 hypothetical protein [Stieleria sp. JC731]
MILICLFPLFYMGNSAFAGLIGSDSTTIASAADQQSYMQSSMQKRSHRDQILEAWSSFSSDALGNTRPPTSSESQPMVNTGWIKFDELKTSCAFPCNHQYDPPSIPSEDKVPRFVRFW